MIWALQEIALPLFLLFLLGLFVGWLLWRWRRRTFSSEQWAIYERQANLADGSTHTNSQSDTRQVGVLSAELKALTARHSRQQVQLSASEKSASLLSNELKALKHNVTELNRTNDKESNFFEAEKQKLAKENERLSSDLELLKSEESEFKKASGAREATLQARADELQGKLNDANAKVDEVKKSDVELNTLRTQHQALSDKAQATDSQLKTSAARISELETRANKTQIELAESQKAHQILRDKFTVVEQQANTGVEASKKLSAVEGQLKAKSESETEARRQLADRESRIAALQEELNKASAQPDQSAELARMQNKLSASEQSAKEMQQKIAASEHTGQELVNTKTQLATLQGQYRGVSDKAAAFDRSQKENDSLQAQLASCKSEGNSVRSKLATIEQQHAATSGERDQLNRQVESLTARLKSVDQQAENAAKADAKIRELETKLAASNKSSKAPTVLAENTSKPKKTQINKSPTNSTEWQVGKTKLGTAGAAHKDDLKVINGIGPVLEKTLNGFGIKTWEQLAVLTSEEEATVDQAIAFPGRIQREQWVKQANELVEQFPVIDERPTRKTFMKEQAGK